MTQEEKQLLLKDLCARLPYGVKCKIDLNALLKAFPEYGVRLSCTATLTGADLHAKVGEIAYTLFGIPTKHCLSFLELDGFFDEYGVPIKCVKPYLRPMSSMTEEERKEYSHIAPGMCWVKGIHIPNANQIDWLDANYFDHRGLIPLGLALEAPEGMYQ